jgi:hypothetical protein
VNYVIPLISDNLLAIKFMFWCYFHLNVGQLDEMGEKRQLASMDKMDLAWFPLSHGSGEDRVSRLSAS